MAVAILTTVFVERLVRVGWPFVGQLNYRRRLRVPDAAK